MTLTEETLQFIREHRKDNVRNLALQAHKYPTVDVPAAIIQIVGRQIAEEKIPAWAAREGILYPTHLSMEQCSSEVTANYKVKIVSDTGYGSRKTFTDRRFWHRLCLPICLLPTVRLCGAAGNTLYNSSS